MALDNPFSGAAAALRGFGLIFRSGLRRYVMVPLVINLLLFGGAIWWGLVELDSLKLWIDGQLPSWLDWLSWLLWPLYFLAVALVGFYTFTLVANVVAAPFNGLLAEKVERLLTGQSLEEGDGWSDALKEAIPATLSALGKLARGLLLAIPFLVLFLIPVVNIIAPFLWLAYGSWMLAAEYLDYPMDNHKIPYKEQRGMRRRRMLSTLTFGAVIMGATLIPVVNFLVMPAAVAGATALWVSKHRS
ncbi:sulfate transporter CysZ [Endothiovibrio diazotrophicus]